MAARHLHPAGLAPYAALLALLALPSRRTAAEDALLRVPGDAPTIEAALAAAPAGATIEVADGVRSGPLRVTRPVTLRAAAGGTVVLAAPPDATAVEVEGTSGVTLQGLRVEGGKTGVRAAKSRGVTVRRCEVIDVTGWAVALQASEVAVEACRIACPPGAFGVGVDGGSEATLRETRVEGTPTVGVFVDRGSSLRMERCEVRGARRAANRGGVLVVVQRSARAALRENLLEGADTAGVEVVTAHATLERDRLLGNGRAGLLAARGAVVGVLGAQILGTVAGADPNMGNGVIAGDRAAVRLADARVEGSAGVGLSVGPGARAEVLATTFRHNARGGCVVEQGGLLLAERAVLEENAGHGLLAQGRGEARLDDVTIRGTRPLGALARGIEVLTGARLRMRGGVVEGSGELGIAVLDGGFADVADARLEGNGTRGITVERGSRARVRRTLVAGHAEIGVALRAGSEAAVFDCEFRTPSGVPVSASEGRLTAAGNRYEGPGARAGERGSSPSLALRPDGEEALEAVLLVRREGGEEVVARLAAAHEAVPVPPGRYRLAARARGGLREVPWGEVTVKDREEIVRLDSGVRLVGGSGPPPRWRAYRLDDPAPVQETAAGVAAGPLPPGRYRVVALDDAGVERPLGPPEGVEVVAGEVTRVDRPREPCCPSRPLALAVAPASWSPANPLRVRVDVAPAPPEEVGVRLFALDPTGRRHGLGRDPAALHPPADVRGEHDLALPADAPEGPYFVVAEAVHLATGRTVAAAEGALLRSARPRLRLVAPREVNPGERLLLLAAVAGMAGRPADLHVSLVSGDRRTWLVEGRDRVTLVPHDRRAPLRLRPALADGLHVLHDAPLPDGWAGGSDLRLEASLVDPATGAELATASTAVRSVAAPVPLRGTLVGPAGARPLATGERVTVAAVRVSAGGPRGRLVARVAPEGTFSFGLVPAGTYALEATAADARGGLWGGEAVRVEAGPTGLPDAAVPLPDAALGAGGVPPAPGGEPAAAPPPAAPPPEPAPCGDAPAGDRCPCGRLPVCVDGGFLAGTLTGGAGSGERERGGWATWWLPRRIEAGLALTFEKAVADALAEAHPCLDVTGVESSLAELIVRVGERARGLEEAFRAVAGAEDVDRALERHPEVAEHFAQALLELFLLEAEADTCVARVRLDGDLSLGSLGVDYRVDTPGLPDGIAENAERFDLESGHVLPPRTTTPPVAPVESAGSVRGRDVAGIADEVARRAAPALAALAESLFCSCAEVTTHCVVERFADHIRGPDVFTLNSCTSVQTCCGRVVGRWTVPVVAPGTSGMAGGSVRYRRTCCGRWEDVFPRAGDRGDGVFCDGGYRRRSRDLDCDGLPNDEDPTPLGEDTPDVLRRDR